MNQVPAKTGAALSAVYSTVLFRPEDLFLIREGAAARRRFGVPAAEMTAYQRKNFMNGPGKLCKGLSIDRSLNGLPLGNGLLELAWDLPELGLPRRSDDLPFHTGKRIGIDYAGEAVDFPWRFWLDE